MARCNMATLILNSKPAAAALAILKEHAGSFDAADRGYPFDLRAFLERAHEKEREREEKILKRAERQFQALWAFAEDAISTADVNVHPLNGRVECGVHVITFDQTEIRTSDSSRPPDEVAILGGGSTLLNARLFGPNVFVFQAGKDLVFLNRRIDRVEALYFEEFSDANFEEFSDAKGAQWCRWMPQ